VAVWPNPIGMDGSIHTMIENSGTVPAKKTRGLSLQILGKYLGTVPELVRETTAMNWAVDGGIERRFHPKDRFKDQLRRLLSRLGAHRMR